MTEQAGSDDTRPEGDSNMVERRPKRRRKVKTPTGLADAGPANAPNKVSTHAPQPAPVPASVSQRFVVVGNSYFFADETLAFVDRGTKLVARTQNIEVVRSLVAIAKARGWDAVGVTGTKEFRREVWREATLQGLEVQGYDASPVERAALQRLIEQRQRHDNAAPAEARRDTAAPPEAHRPTAASTPPSGERSSADQAAPAERLTGRLVEHGAAPYKFIPGQALSYYVKLRTAHGDRMIWGVDLERAVIESGSSVRVGDVVAVENLGSQRVRVRVPQRDAAGQLVGDTAIETRRNHWRIETPAWFAERAEQAAAFRAGEVARQELVRQYPDLTNAVIGLWLGEQFAGKVIDRPEDRERVVALIRDKLADAVERGEAVNVPMIERAVARKLGEVAPGAGPVSQRARTWGAQRDTRAYSEREAQEPPHVRG